MKKLIIGGLAALAIGLTAAPVAQAAPYTAADLDFIAAVLDIGISATTASTSSEVPVMPCASYPQIL